MVPPNPEYSGPPEAAGHSVYRAALIRWGPEDPPLLTHLRFEILLRLLGKELGVRDGL